MNIFRTAAVALGMALATCAPTAPVTAAITTTINFDNGTAPGFTGNYAIFQGTSAFAAAPHVGGPNTTKYLAVPSNFGSAVGTAFLTLPRAVTSFAFDWGSTDTHNTLSFVNDKGVTVATYNGVGNGNQTSPTTNIRWVGTFDPKLNVSGAVFRSTNRAFEIDNITASSAVPEPESWLLIVVGFGLVGAISRGKQEVVTA